MDPNSSNQNNQTPPLTGNVSPSQPHFPPDVTAVPSSSLAEPVAPSINVPLAVSLEPTLTTPVEPVVSPQPIPQAPVQSVASQPVVSEPVQSQPSTPQEPEKKKSNKKLIAGLVVILLMVILPVTVFVSRQQQNIKSGAAPSILSTNPVVAIFDGQQIHVKDPTNQNDIYSVALENYPSDQADNADVLKSARDTWVERKILDREQQSNNITVPEDEVTNLESTQDLSPQEAHYAVLKEKVTLLEVNSVEAISIGFWYPPQSALQAGYQGLNAAQIQDMKNQIEVSKAALAEIKTAISTQDPVDLVNVILTKPQYGVLLHTMGLNGHLISPVDAPQWSKYASPQIYESGDSSLDTSSYSLLFSSAALAVGAVGVSQPTDTNSSGYVFKVVQRGNAAGAATYQDWYQQQLDSLVTYPSPDSL